MNNFLMMGQLDTLPLLASVTRQGHLWGQYRIMEHIRGDWELTDIVLRHNKFNEGQSYLMSVYGELVVENYPARALLPEVNSLIQTLVGRVSGEHLGRVAIHKLDAGKKQSDFFEKLEDVQDLYVGKKLHDDYYDSYIVVLQGDVGVAMESGGEIIYPPVSSVWWVNRKAQLAVSNLTANPLIWLSIDIASPKEIYTPNWSQLDV